MRNQLILAAAAVPSLRVADVEYNTEQIIRLIAENSRCGLIVFPELSECYRIYMRGSVWK